MSISIKRFGNEKSIAILARIMELARSSARITRFDVMAATNMGESTCGEYLRHLVVMGELFRTTAPTWGQGGRTATEYALTGGPDADEDDRDNYPRRVVVRKTWEPYHARMSMDCYLFGTPARLQESA